jgi:hypothetical protein
MRNASFSLAAAIQCLKKKKLYETQIEQLSNFQLRVHDQVTEDKILILIAHFRSKSYKGCNKLISRHYFRLLCSKVQRQLQIPLMLCALDHLLSRLSSTHCKIPFSYFFQVK